jgi:hypothetical protein
MTTERVRIFQKVCQELDELKARGVKVPRTAYVIADSEAREFYDGGMSVPEISDFCISLAGVKR